MANNLAITISGQDEFLGLFDDLNDKINSISTSALDELTDAFGGVQGTVRLLTNDIKELEKSLKGIDSWMNNTNAQALTKGDNASDSEVSLQKNNPAIVVLAPFELTEGKEGSVPLSKIPGLDYAALFPDEYTGNSKTGADAYQNKIGNMAAESVNNFLSSDAVLGKGFASLITKTVTGAIVMAPTGPGALVGAAIGFTAGLLDIITLDLNSKTAAMKDLRSNILQSTMDMQQQNLTIGKAVAADRRSIQTDLEFVFKDSDNEYRAAQEFGKLRELSNTSGYALDEVYAVYDFVRQNNEGDEEFANLLKPLLAAGDQNNLSLRSMMELSEIFRDIGESAYVTPEHVAALNNLNFDVSHYLSPDDIANERITGAQGLEDIYTGIMDSAEDFTGGYALLQSKIASREEDAMYAYGKGYEETRAEGLKEQVEYLEKYGDERNQLYEQMGAYQAELENEQERLYREKEEELIDRMKRERLEDEKTNREVFEEFNKMHVDAQAAYYESDGYEQYSEGMKSLVEYSTGLLNNNEKILNAVTSVQGALQEGIKVSYYDDIDFNAANQAYGLPYVPYDNFPARLHEGEMVLTASEARTYRSGMQPVVTVSGNQFTVREEADIDRIASALAQELRRAQLVS